jgi:peptidoglycan hydrolase-like protein with peptidoglycan-binding domain
VPDRILQIPREAHIMRSYRFSKEPQLSQVESGNTLLTKGSKGQGVAQVQILLNYLGNDMPRSFTNRTPDGDFGSETEQVVKRFQQENGLKPDGIIGKLTMAKLDDMLVKQPCFDSACPITYRARIRAKSSGPPEYRPVFYT